MDSEFNIGDHVEKATGYRYPGVVRGISRGSALRYVVEADHPDFAGMLHIFSGEQLRLRAPSALSTPPEPAPAAGELPRELDVALRQEVVAALRKDIAWRGHINEHGLYEAIRPIIARYAAPPVADGWQMVPVAALKWLFGEGPDDKGRWFGDGEHPPGAFWWRTPFRLMLSAAPSPPPRAADADVTALVEALNYTLDALSSFGREVNWGASALSGETIQKINEAPGKVRAALSRIPTGEAGR